MDTVKIGKFLADLRREKDLTQEQLGEEIGVTNKTISRWETGSYLPPVEMLQILSDKYGVSINEILSGERLDDKAYRQKAEDNIKTALEKSAFTMKDKQKYLNKKWLKDHRFELILEMLVIIACVVLSVIFYPEITFVASIACIVWAFITANRKAEYIERRLYGDKSEQENKPEDNS